MNRVSASKQSVEEIKAYFENLDSETIANLQSIYGYFVTMFTLRILGFLSSSFSGFILLVILVQKNQNLTINLQTLLCISTIIASCLAFFNISTKWFLFLSIAFFIGGAGNILLSFTFFMVLAGSLQLFTAYLYFTVWNRIRLTHTKSPSKQYMRLYSKLYADLRRLFTQEIIDRDEMAMKYLSTKWKGFLLTDFMVIIAVNRNFLLLLRPQEITITPELENATRSEQFKGKMTYAGGTPLSIIIDPPYINRLAKWAAGSRTANQVTVHQPNVISE